MIYDLKTLITWSATNWVTDLAHMVSVSRRTMSEWACTLGSQTLDLRFHCLSVKPSIEKFDTNKSHVHIK